MYEQVANGMGMGKGTEAVAPFLTQKKGEYGRRRWE